MPRGNDVQHRCHYKGKNDDFIVFVESAEAVSNWKSDKSIPLAQVVDGWKVFVTGRHGTQGILDGASNQMLDEEFGTHREEDVVQQILEKGSLLKAEESGRGGSTNDSKGARAGH